MNHTEAIEGFEVAIAALLEKMSICEFYSEVYTGVSLPSQSATHSQRLQDMVDFALPELYAAVIVFAVKATSYFKARGMYIVCWVHYYTDLRLGIKKLANILQPFDLEFQPFIKEIDAKEEVIREFAGAATMKRIGSMYSSIHGMLFRYIRVKSHTYTDIDHALQDMALELKPLAKLSGR